ncbi:PaaI family thioesterase [Hydrogenophaga sp. YM1]|jgi:uncharacterized protein (TIGR00369 family)|uniref:PaaI family thioesterase n=1 Tax=unclassified Hydrogenophaga TaxID=2610897 RepID=UPI00086D3A6C|nr:MULTISPECIES: PaaI family thioesterase [unclassified Hydrogenophaga]MBN9370082.1 PaaI family thioesterase [Hydrogenophaga sp.]ODT34197.1 MAG: thioesterase [Hydrogenophaga sp. SCN 70-13]OJV72370.1 MAG: thioesterase [Hydrogenophaga sp. 70-12]QRR34396.1 PaaI family thioesterase [Hydrogenophaga sp. YM1]
MRTPSPITLDNPFLEHIGVRLAEWHEGYSEFHLPVRAELLNRQGVLQGGVLSTLLDVACGYAGLYSPPMHEPTHGHTVSLTVNFINKASSGLVVTKGFLVQRTRTLFFARAEAWHEGTLLLASAQGSFKLTGRSR